MLSRRLLASLTCLGLSACGSQTAATEQASIAPATAAPEPAVEASPTPSVAREVAGEVEAAPALTLTVVKTDGRVTLAMQNRGRTNVRFSANVQLEEGDARREFPLQLDETHPLPACAELAPGALLELHVTPEQTGEHRFALLSCNGSARTESETFRL
jgi:hypothetical protein